jgi:predicted Zn-ribbon and HTH transcriptional regulator
MSRPTLEVADIIRTSGSSFWERQGSHLAWQHRKVMDAIVRCRTAALGGHRDQCLRCGYQTISYNSCRNRHCPKCQGNARAKWLAARAVELLPVPYFHVVFTLPHELSGLVLQNKRLLYDLLFRSSAATLLEVARNPKHLGADIGLLSVLHTWGQNLQHHPHVHCVVPAGGLALDGSGWIAASPRFFLPVRILSRLFRGKFTAGLKQLLLHNKLQFHGALQELATPERFQQFLRQLFSKEWVVYAKPPFGGAEHILHYLARYTHRVAISNHRLVAFKKDRVSFRWKDYACGGKQKVMTVSADEFLRRFLIHVLPRGLVRIRHFGLFANRKRAASLLRCRFLLGTPSSPQQPAPSVQPRCPQCSEPMLVVERMTSSQLLVRCTLTMSGPQSHGVDSS